MDGKQPAGSYAAANHNHSGVYQPVGSYAAASHTHDDRYYTESEINTKLAVITSGTYFRKCGNVVEFLCSDLRGSDLFNTVKIPVGYRPHTKTFFTGIMNNGSNLLYNIYGTLNPDGNIDAYYFLPESGGHVANQYAWLIYVTCTYIVN